ncbi:cadherin-like beta sandwich domain-containing protein [Cohnella hashimotonis]|uniref:Cadherin-like beta sandwich domain-containing protein n=1 Tax=Cohnella hashimotonis TaxID=2826895 RepID=A0ABT6TPR3_9BACL|nr:cadherin-like beta sandwich domain-containing protein [Cohnella hashimotonis]MDI4648755.1 cadherin-like beta sandwich domain-containing protein [Cohnella hashimotonis]
MSRNRLKKYAVMMLVFMLAAGMLPAGGSRAAGAAIVDQQSPGSPGGVWINADSGLTRYQTFTPAVTGSLSAVELSLDASGSGDIIVYLYRESDRSAPLATARTGMSSGWVTFDFSGASPYLTKNTMYRLAVTTEYGGYNGVMWSIAGGDPYPRGASNSYGYDFGFRTYMVADESTSADYSEIEVGDARLLADGASQTSVTVRLKDAQGDARTSGGEAVVISSTRGTIGETTDNLDGTYTATLTADTTLGTAIVSAGVDGSPLTSTASVQFVEGDVSPSRSAVTAGGTSIRADGSSTLSIFATLKDDYDHPLAGREVTLEADGGESDIEAVNGTTDASGTAEFKVSNLAMEEVTYSAKDAESGLTLDGTVKISFLYDQPPSIRIRVTPEAPTYNEVFVWPGASAYGEYNEIADMKWAKGSHPLSYFPSGGRTLGEGFWVGENGIYTVYAVDTAGNASVKEVDIQNILRKSSDAALSAWTITGNGAAIPFDFEAGKTDYTVQVATSVDSLKMALTASSAYADITLNGSAIDSDAESGEFPLTPGDNTFEIVVEAQDGTVRTYTLNVVREQPMSGDAALSAWTITGNGAAIPFDFEAGKTDYAVQVATSVDSLKMVLSASNAYAGIAVNGSPIGSGFESAALPLAVGNNTFEIAVKAQDGTVRTYTLNVVRAEPTTIPVDNGGTGSVNPDMPVDLIVNETVFPWMAFLKKEADGKKSIEARLDLDRVTQVISRSGPGSAAFAFVVKEEADRYTLRLSADAAVRLAERTADVTFQTSLGRYKLPFAEAMRDESRWADEPASELLVVLERSAITADMKKEADAGGFRLVGEPVDFGLYVKHRGATFKMDSSNRFITGLLNVPADAADVSTAMRWDGGRFRPVPTAFTAQNGQGTAVFRSLTHGTFILAAQTFSLTDLEGHWAKSEIRDMTGRMIVNGFEGGRFMPRSVVTRAELAVMLAKALGLPKVEEASVFRDVKAGSWYKEEVSAVHAYGLMDGIGEDAFGPDRQVSREEAIVTMIRALRLALGAEKLDSLRKQAEMGTFADSSFISSRAVEEVRTAVGIGLVKGEGGKLNPQQPLSRAVTAVLLYRMLLLSGMLGGDS